jgi:hypothetical protein
VVCWPEVKPQGKIEPGGHHESSFDCLASKLPHHLALRRMDFPPNLNKPSDGQESSFRTQSGHLNINHGIWIMPVVLLVGAPIGKTDG